ncbi:hypothetical protein OG593_04970 [Streptomyces atratus]
MLGAVRRDGRRARRHGRAVRSRYASLALLGCVVLCYALLDRFPDNPVVRPHVYLSVLVLALGGLACLGGS